MTTKQFYGRKSDVMIKVPKGVRKEAQMALDLKKIGFVGATETGWKRANQLVSKEFIPIQDVRYIRNWYARHIYTSMPGYLEWEDFGKLRKKEWFKHRAVLSWLTWGGTPGLNWVNSNLVINKLNNYFDTSYTKFN